MQSALVCAAAGDTTTPLSILAHAGQDCTEEFHRIHRVYPVAYKQLPAFLIGKVASEESELSEDSEDSVQQ